MRHVPVSLLYYTSTKQHYGFKDVYLTTLADIDRQLPLISFNRLVAHIKVSTGEQDLGATMKAELESRGFDVLTTVADWSRGLSHTNGYMRDVLKVSRHSPIHDSPYVLWAEDDQTMTCHKTSLEAVLARMISLIEASPDTLSARFVRATDMHDTPVLKDCGDHFYCPWFNFQPNLMRSRDFHLAAKVIEDQFDRLSHIHCESLWAMVLAGFSRSDLKHIVFHPDYCESIHLGLPEYPQIKAALGL